MEADNVSTSNFVTLDREYLPDACINVLTSLLGIPVNLWLLVEGIRQSRGKFKSRFSVCLICMAFCQLYGAVGQFVLYILYIIGYSTNSQLTVWQCSLIRRILQATTIPPVLSIFVVSLDRFLLLRFSIRMHRLADPILFSLIFAYSLFVYVPLQLAFGRIVECDICTYALMMPRQIGIFVEPIQPTFVLIAIFMDLCTLHFFYGHHNESVERLPGTGLKRIRLGLYGILLQALVVFIFVLPQSVNLSMYNIDLEDIPHKATKTTNTYGSFLNACAKKKT